jgi:heme oxygenase
MLPCSMLVAVSASFLSPLPAQTRQPGSVARSAVKMLPPAPPTAEEKARKSFVQYEMRSAAMKLHTRDQAPKEGQQPAEKPVSKWEPGREEYLQFLVDSRHVYQCLEDIVNENEVLSTFADSGLERATALEKDIAWFKEEGLEAPPLGSFGKAYAERLREIAAAGEWEVFVCHFYNFYFAHTAGGRMIGKMMSDKLLGGRTLEFYQWERGDPKDELLPALRLQIDNMADTWTREQKDACLAETAATFKGGGSLLTYLREPVTA